jgi:hypothetical protein
MNAPPFHALLDQLERRRVRYVLIGVGGANHYATDPSAYFKTYDRDLFVPPDPANLVEAWAACEALGLALTCSGETLDMPRDLWLAERIVQNRALTPPLPRDARRGAARAPAEGRAAADRLTTARRRTPAAGAPLPSSRARTP